MAPARIRSVDTNAIMWPSRLLTPGEQLTPASQFAKCATVVAELYSEQLQAGEPIPAKAWWVRFIPTDELRTPNFDGVPFSDGMGEVHEVPYDPTVLALPDGQRRRAILDWLHQHLLALAASLGWPTAPLTQAYRGCLDQDVRLIRTSRPKSDPGRRYRARTTFELDENGDGWARLPLEGAGISLTSDPADALPTLRSAARTWRTQRWDDHLTASVQPWPPPWPPPPGVTHELGRRLTLSVPS
jgi:hypothetical protein